MGRRDRCRRRALQELPPERAPVDEDTQQLLAALALSKQSHEQEQRQRLVAYYAQEQQTSQFHAETAPSAETADVPDVPAAPQAPPAPQTTPPAPQAPPQHRRGRRRRNVEELPPEAPAVDDETAEVLAVLAASRQEKAREDALRARHASEAAALRQLKDARRAERRRIAVAEERRRAKELVARTREEARRTVNGGGAASARALRVADVALTKLHAPVALTTATPERRLTAVQAFVWRAAAALGERELNRLRRTTLALGLVRANELLAATLDLETDGGLLTADGSRRRTPGGVFFTLVKQLVPRDMYRAIFHDPLDEKIRRGAKSTRRLLRQRRERVANAPTLTGAVLESLGRTGSTDDEPPASEEADDEADLSCPITLELFVDPVRAADGFVYERQAIVDWFARPVKGGVLSPATGAPLEDLDLAPAPDVLERVRALAV